MHYKYTLLSLFSGQLSLASFSLSIVSSSPGSDRMIGIGGMALHQLSRLRWGPPPPAPLPAGRIQRSPEKVPKQVVQLGMTDDINQGAAELNRIAQNLSERSWPQITNVCRRIARQIEAFSGDLTDANRIFSEVMDDTQDSLEILVWTLVSGNQPLSLEPLARISELEHAKSSDVGERTDTFNVFYHGLCPSSCASSKPSFGPKPKPRWDVHLPEVGGRVGSLAGGIRPLIAGPCGSGA